MQLIDDLNERMELDERNRMSKIIQEKDIEKWKEIIKELHRIVNDIGWHECCTADGKCSPYIMHAIIHVNKARTQLEQAIEAINERMKLDKG